MDCADKIQQLLTAEKRAGRLTTCNLIAPLIRPLILEREQEVRQEALAVGAKKRVRQTLGMGIPPNPDDVTAYSVERGYPLDGARWCDLYAAKGWIVSGRARMKDWRAAVRTWQANGWGQEGPHPIALKKLPPKPADPRYAPEPQGDWRKTARRVLNVEELPPDWKTWSDVPPEYRGKIVAIHMP